MLELERLRVFDQTWPLVGRWDPAEVSAAGFDLSAMLRVEPCDHVVDFNFYPDNMSANVILPLGHDRTLTVFEWFVVAQPGTGGGWESMQPTIAFSDQIQQEDIVRCEQVQKGLRSRSDDIGRFSARREGGVHHFQGLVRAFPGS